MNKSVLARTSVLVGAAAVSMTLLPAPANAESDNPCGRSWAEWTNQANGFTGRLVEPLRRRIGREVFVAVTQSHYAYWSLEGFGSGQGVDRVDFFHRHPWLSGAVQFNTDRGLGWGKMYTITLFALSCSTHGVTEAEFSMSDFDTKAQLVRGIVTAN
jgi:hypothetical protein